MITLLFFTGELGLGEFLTRKSVCTEVELEETKLRREDALNTPKRLFIQLWFLVYH